MENFSRLEDTNNISNIIEKRDTDLKRIVDNRTLPGLLLLELGGNILSCNPYAHQSIVNKEHRDWILAHFEDNPSPKFVVKTVIYSNNRSYGIRAFSLSNESKTENSLTIAVLIEDISTDRIDFGRVNDSESCHFTPRETEVIKALHHGLTDKMIAIQLKISPETVHGYVKSIRAKLGVSTRTAILHKLFNH